MEKYLNFGFCFGMEIFVPNEEQGVVEVVSERVICYNITIR